MRVLVGLSYEGKQNLTDFILKYISKDLGEIDFLISDFLKNNRCPFDEKGEFWPPVIKMEGHDGFQKVYMFTKQDLVFNEFEEI